MEFVNEPSMIRAGAPLLRQRLAAWLTLLGSIGLVTDDYDLFAATGTGMPAIFRLTDNSALRLVK